MKNPEKSTKKKETLGIKMKNAFAELRNVSWPSFGKTVKQTGVVIGFVLISALLLFGLDRLLAWLFGLLVSVGG